MRALAFADEVYLGTVNRAEKLSAGDRFDTIAVAQHLEALGGEAHTATSNALLLEKLLANLAGSAQPRVVAFFTNGSFDGIIGQFVAAMR